MPLAEFEKKKSDFKDTRIWTNNNTIFANDCVYYPGVADSIHQSIVHGSAIEAYVIFTVHPCADGVY